MPILKREIDKLQKKIKPITMRLKLINRQISRQKLSKNKKRLSALRKRKFRMNSQEERINSKISTFKSKYTELQNSDDKASNNNNFWFIKEKRFYKKKKFANIPENCVIVSLNSKTVSHIENWKFPLAQNFIAFPRIILKKNLETKNIKRKQSITRSSVKSEIYSWEKDTFHAPKKEYSKFVQAQPNVKISLVK
jgi:hypothetical protein